MRAFSVVYINQIDQSIPSTTEMVKFGKDGVNGKLVAKGGISVGTVCLHNCNIRQHALVL